MAVAHKISLDYKTQRIRVQFQGVTLADSTRVIRLNEGALAPVYYFPREDIAMEHLQRSDHQTHCPFKGNAVYWSIRVAGATAADAVWSYEHPLAEVEAIAWHLAFYPQHIEIVEDG